MPIDMNKRGDLLGKRAPDLSGASMQRGETRTPEGRKWLSVLVAALIATAIAWLVGERDRHEPVKPAFPLHAVRVRQGPEHMKAVRFVEAREAGEAEAKVLVDQGGTMVGDTYVSDLKEVPGKVRQEASPAAVIIDPDGGANQQFDLPEGCNLDRVRSMVGKEIVVHTEHWRWTGGRETPIGRVVHTIDKPGLFESLCGIKAGPRKTR